MRETDGREARVRLLLGLHRIPEMRGQEEPDRPAEGGTRARETEEPVRRGPRGPQTGRDTAEGEAAKMRQSIPTLDIGLGMALGPKVRRRVRHAFPRSGFALEAELLAANVWVYPELKVPLSACRYSRTGLSLKRMRAALMAFWDAGWLEPKATVAPDRAGLRGLSRRFSRQSWRRGPEFGKVFPRRAKVPRFLPRACLNWRGGPNRRGSCLSHHRQYLDCRLGWAACPVALWELRE